MKISLLMSPLLHAEECPLRSGLMSQSIVSKPTVFEYSILVCNIGRKILYPVVIAGLRGNRKWLLIVYCICFSMLGGTWLCVYRHQVFSPIIYQIFMQKYKTDREAQ